MSGSFASDDGQYLRHTLNLKDETWDDYLKDLSFSDSISIIVKLMRPQSRGIVTLRSADPRQKVKVSPKVFYNFQNKNNLFWVLIHLEIITLRFAL